MVSLKSDKCCYCVHWKLLTEDGETGWCKDYEIDPITLKHRRYMLVNI